MRPTRYRHIPGALSYPTMEGHTMIRCRRRLAPLSLGLLLLEWWIYNRRIYI